MSDRETLVVIVGAGASMMAGVSSTQDLTKLAKRVMPLLSIRGVTYKLSTGTKMNIGVDILMSDVLDQGLRADFGSDYDFEVLLGALEELETFVGRRYNPEGRSDVNIPILGSFAELMRRFECVNDDGLLRETRLAILEAVHAKTSSDSEHPQNGHIAKPAREQIERMFTVLANQFRLVVIDFNYDDLIDRIPVAWNDGFTTVVPDKFCSLFNPKDWRAKASDSGEHLLIHQHGSVRFGYAPPDTVTVTSRFAEPAKYDHLAGATNTISGRRTSGTTVDGRNADAAYIISGLNKAGKVTYNARPYGYYFASASQLLAQTNRLLVLGYGWRDLHVNTWVNEYVALHPDRRTAVVTYRPGSIVGEETMEHRGLMGVAGQPAWNKINNRAFARTTEEKAASAPSRFTIERGFAIAPEGFIMETGDEEKLLDFIAT